MLQNQMIELVQEFHPDAGETKIRILLNQGMRKFVEKTRVLSRNDCTVTHVANQRMYDLSAFTNIDDKDDVLDITQVDLDEEPIDRLIGQPSETDVT